MQHSVRFTPDNKAIRVRAGLTLLDAARSGKVPVRTRCGGHASCLMCKVLVHRQDGLTAPSHNEALKLGQLLEQGYRLACQAKVIGEVTVEVPEDPLKAAVRRQLSGQSLEDEDWFR